jgi:hypothetical protein
VGRYRGVSIVFSGEHGGSARIAGIRRGIRNLDYFKLAAWIAILLGSWGALWLIGHVVFAIF